MEEVIECIKGMVKPEDNDQLLKAIEESAHHLFMECQHAMNIWPTWDYLALHMFKSGLAANNHPQTTAPRENLNSTVKLLPQKPRHNDNRIEGHIEKRTHAPILSRRLVETKWHLGCPNCGVALLLDSIGDNRRTSTKKLVA
nr:hypothetical protein Iba_chr10dCG12610 [Ipomoea batatas]